MDRLEDRNKKSVLIISDSNTKIEPDVTGDDYIDNNSQNEQAIQNDSITMKQTLMSCFTPQSMVRTKDYISLIMNKCESANPNIDMKMLGLSPKNKNGQRKESDYTDLQTTLELNGLKDE